MKKPWVRLVLATSIDGRLAFPNGEPKQLGGPADRKVLEESLAWADATLIGAKTILAHRSTCEIHTQSLINQRLLENRSKQPIAIVVSRKQKFSGDWYFFKQPIQKWLLTSNEKGNDDQLEDNYYFDRNLPLLNNWADTISMLAHEGLNTILVLGGAKLASSMLKADVIAELQLTIIPIIIGGTQIWISDLADNWPSQQSKKGSWIMKDNRGIGEHELLLRYCRNCD